MLIRKPEKTIRTRHTDSFASMKHSSAQLLGLAGQAFKGGADAFLHKGTNERWRAVLSGQDLADCRAALAAYVPTDLAQWVEFGRLAAFDPSSVPAEG